MRPTLHQVRVPNLPRRKRPWPTAQTPGAVTSWIVNGGSITLQQGSVTPFDVAATGPAGYVAGGNYSVDPAVPLPAGMTLSAGGSLLAGSAAPGSVAGVVFKYHEPGALPTLTLHSTNAGTLPYLATAYPAEGAVPSGQILVSPTDANLRSSVLSTWPDGSAQVVVIAGEMAVPSNGQTAVRLVPGLATGAALTDARIAQLVTDVTVNFTGTPQSLSLASATKDRTWWANERVICNRYRLSCGLGVLEAVIDIHAFASNRAFIEVVVENGKLSTSAPVKPTAQTYAGATVSVNGTQITPVGGVGSAWTTSGYLAYGDNTKHEAFRAWYCSGWVGGNPGIVVTHDPASMQAHPWFYRIDKASSINYLTYVPKDGNGYDTYWRDGDTVAQAIPYAQDLYKPWSFGRAAYQAMGTGGSNQMYGPIGQPQARYLQTGDKYCLNSVRQCALSMMTYAVHYRSSLTNAVPTHASIAGKNAQDGSYPKTGGQFGGDTGWGTFEVAHQVEVGLTGFLSHPSPCFIELAQKIAHWNATADNTNGQLFRGGWQTRGKAFAMRALCHAIFLTPTTLVGDTTQTAWRASALSNADVNVTYQLTWPMSAENKLGYMWEYTTAANNDSDPLYYDHSNYGVHSPDGVPFQYALWLHQWYATEVYKIHLSKVLAGQTQANIGALADWALLQPIRWVNEQPNGGWRYICYRQTAGTADGSNNTTIGQLNDWGTMRAYRNSDTPRNDAGVSSVSGSWRTSGANDLVDYHHGTAYLTDWIKFDGPNQDLMYVPVFWSALCLAVERGVSGADAAWSTVLANVSNLDTWRNWGAIQPQYNHWPRNK
jgi:hypothetical protein